MSWKFLEAGKNFSASVGENDFGINMERLDRMR